MEKIINSNILENEFNYLKKNKINNNYNYYNNKILDLPLIKIVTNLLNYNINILNNINIINRKYLLQNDRILYFGLSIILIGTIINIVN